MDDHLFAEPLSIDLAMNGNYFHIADHSTDDFPFTFSTDHSSEDFFQENDFTAQSINPYEEPFLDSSERGFENEFDIFPQPFSLSETKVESTQTETSGTDKNFFLQLLKKIFLFLFFFK